ncbi:hypothetical protein KI688_005834 [Linnemannia hyalina]|uniref:Uncharacterized protein n=1 Tax=Linnemannia hyalina TaxID=64524 RepID=A0A9P8BXV0_9FUNG|nr:hypothetical protein KI688_005834 [Linnemannia hyalina]
MFKYVLIASALAAVGSAYNLLTVCNDANFKGNCVTWTGDLKKCYGLNEYKGAVSSAKIFGSIRCNLYRKDGCKGGGIVITGPAYNLQEQNFNDAASSFYCHFN